MQCVLISGVKIKLLHAYAYMRTYVTKVHDGNSPVKSSAVCAAWFWCNVQCMCVHTTFTLPGAQMKPFLKFMRIHNIY